MIICDLCKTELSMAETHEVIYHLEDVHEVCMPCKKTLNDKEHEILTACKEEANHTFRAWVDEFPWRDCNHYD